MDIIGLINDSPASIVGLYIIGETLKALWRHRDTSKKSDFYREKEITKTVMNLLEVNKKSMVSEKEEISKMECSLKRANFEISILERKVATLMGVIDKCISENSSAHLKFETAMANFNIEIDNMRKIKNV